MITLPFSFLFLLLLGEEFGDGLCDLTERRCQQNQ